MHVSVRAVDFVLTHSMREAVEERLACALAWTGRPMARLVVLLSCVAGTGGKLLKRCKIQVQLRDGRELVVEDIKPDFPLAAERAANRIDRFLRQAGKKREARRGPRADTPAALAMKEQSWTG